MLIVSCRTSEVVKGVVSEHTFTFDASRFSFTLDDSLFTSPLT